MGVAEAGAGVDTTTGELAGARWLDAEDATMAHVLAWAVEHDPDMAGRLVTALSVWWVLRGRLAGQGPLLRELAGRAGPGSEGWCAAQIWLAWAAFDAADLPQALRRCTEVIDVIGDREPSRRLVDCLTGQSGTLSSIGRRPEAAGCARRALAIARELGYPYGQVRAATCLVLTALYAGDLDEAAQLARQAGQIPDIPGKDARLCSFLLAATLAEIGDLAAARQACAATLAWARDADDLYNLTGLLPMMADLDLRADRTSDAAARLHEAAQIMLSSGEWFTIVNILDRCGHLCAATGRPADAVTAWAAEETLIQQDGLSYPDDSDVRRRQEAWREAGRVLGPDRARAAEQRGKAMSLATAAEYAQMLTGPGSAQPTGAALPGKLSARERELVTLVAQGRTDAQIAAQLSISIRTVRSHLDRIRDKTGCRRRADLTRLASADGRSSSAAHRWGGVVLPDRHDSAKRGNPAAAAPRCLLGEPAVKAGTPGQFRTPELIMSAYPSRRRTHPHTAARLRRIIATLAVVAGGLLAGSPPSRPPPPRSSRSPQTARTGPTAAPAPGRHRRRHAPAGRSP